jgi:hypothetical protein
MFLNLSRFLFILFHIFIVAWLKTQKQYHWPFHRLKILFLHVKLKIRTTQGMGLSSLIRMNFQFVSLLLLYLFFVKNYQNFAKWLAPSALPNNYFSSAWRLSLQDFWSKKKLLLQTFGSQIKSQIFKTCLGPKLKIFLFALFKKVNFFQYSPW